MPQIPTPPEPDAPEARLALWLVVIVLAYAAWLTVDRLGRADLENLLQKADTPEQAI